MSSDCSIVLLCTTSPKTACAFEASPCEGLEEEMLLSWLKTMGKSADEIKKSEKKGKMFLLLQKSIIFAIDNHLRRKNLA